MSRVLALMLRHGRALQSNCTTSCSGGPSSSSIQHWPLTHRCDHSTSSTCTTAPLAYAWGACSSQRMRISTSSSTAAPSPSAPTAAAAAAAKAPVPASKKAGKGRGGGKGAMGGPEELQAATPSSEVPSLDVLKASYQPSRLHSFWLDVLSRELMLKLSIEHVGQLPKLEHVEVSIHARDVLKAANVEKWQMLLYALALEYVTGQPAKYTQSRQKYYRMRNAVTGVHVKLTKRRAYDFLEKLVYVVLPSQNAFEGLLLKSLDMGGNIHFRVSKMANYPDFEELYETFENLGGFHVNVKLSNVATAPARSQLLLTGLQLPVFAKRRRAGADADEEAAEEGAAAPAAAGTQSSDATGSGGVEQQQ